jgi:hypothetical protein
MSKRRRKLDMAKAKGHTAPRRRDDLIAWRVGRLRSAGLDPKLARLLADDRRYDLHALLELVDRGCPPALAVRILAPIDAVEPC